MPIVEETVVSSGEILCIESGEILDDVIVNSGGSLIVASDGTANSTTVYSGGKMYVSNGGTANSTTLNSGGSLTVSSGGTADNTSIDNGILFASSGGTANLTTVVTGRLNAFGATVNDTTVNSLGKLNVESGTVSNTVLNEKGAMLRIDSDGTVYNTTVSSGGTINFLSGMASNTIISSGGTLSFSNFPMEGNRVIDTLVVKDGGRVQVTAGGKLTGKMTFESGASISMLNHSFLDFDLTRTPVGAEALVNDLSLVKLKPTYTLTVDGTQTEGVYLLAGGAADFTGAITVMSTSGDKLGRLRIGTSATFSDVGYVLNLSEDVLSLQITLGGVSPEVISDLVLENESRTVKSGQFYLDTTIGSDGRLTVENGGTADTTTVNLLGVLYVTDGGSAIGATVNSSGKLTVLNGGMADTTTVNASGVLAVTDGGIAAGVTVNSGGGLRVSAGATATNIMENGGNVIVKDGATVSFLANTFSAVTLNDKTTATVHSGTTAASTTVNLGLLDVSSGGIANGTTVNSHGVLYVSSGGSASSAIINSGGCLTVFSDGTAENTRINSGGKMIISSGGTAENTNATSSGTVTILNGGVASNVFVRSSGIIDVSSGGKLTGKVICLHGVISTVSGAIVDFDLTHKSPGAAALYFFDSNHCLIQGAPTYTITVNSDQAEGLYSLSNYANGFDKQITVQNTEGTALGVLSVGETVTISDTAYTLSVSDNTLSLKIGENNSSSPYTSDGVVIYTGRGATVSSGEIYHDTEIWGGRLTVLSGGTADVASIHAFNEYGSVFISSGGSANNVTVNSICYLLIYGTVNSAEVKSAGELRIFSGGKVTGKLTFEREAVITAHRGAVVNFDVTQAEAGSEALVNDLSVIQGTPLYTLTVDGTQASGIYALAGGAAAFNRTITVQNTLGTELGTLTVGTPATISDAKYALSISDDGVLSLQITVVSSGLVLENTKRTVSANELYLDTTINSGGSLVVASDGMADTTTVNSGGRMSISSDGTATNIEVNCGGSLSVGRDGTATIIENGGNVIVNEGAIVTFQANTFSAVTLNDKTTATVHSGTTAASTTVNSGGRMTISGGGKANDTIVNSGGTLFLSSGGAAENTRISFGARMTISSGGTAEKTNATSSGTVTILNGGVASNVCVRADGKILISSGGKLTGKVIDLGGVIFAASGAIVDFDLTHKLPGAAALYFFDYLYRGFQESLTFTVTVNSDQAEGIYSLCNPIKKFNQQITVQNTEGTALGVLSVGETVTISDTAYTLNLTDNQLILKIGESITPSPYTSDGVVVYRGSSATVSSGEIYHDTEIWGGQMYVLSGGTADIVSIYPFSRGSVFISFGGSVNSVTVNSFCSMFVSGGGTVNIAEIKSGGELHVSSGGTATEVKEDGGYVSVANGADVTFVPNTINGLLLENAKATVHSVTTVTDITINTSANLYISSGGVANNTTVNSGWLHISSGGKANSTAIIKGTREVGGAMFVSRGGVADDTTIQGGGWMDVSSGGVANNTMVNASMFVYSGGTANGITVSGSGLLHVGFSSGNWFEPGGMVNDIVVSGGSMNVAYGGKASITTVNSRGRLSVVSGGTVNSTTVNGSASMFVSSGGKANSTTVNSGGTLSISSGGKANGITVNSGGSIAAIQYGSMTGKMVFESDAVVSMAKGAILDFDLTQAETGGAALVNDLSVIKGLPTYTLTVSGKEAYGIYTLAEGAADFTGTITVQNKFGKGLGTLTAGGTLTVDGTDYLLSNDKGALSVTVKETGDTPASKWTYLVYMAADSNICNGALYDIVSMQQANIDPGIEIYVLVDRSPVGSPENGDYPTPNGTYKWDSSWSDTRVGKITYSPDLTVTVDWESWGELDTGSIATLERFVTWGQEQSPAENYGLILWDHGGENAQLCWDLTTDPNWGACISISEISDLLKKKGNIPIVIFNNCLLGSEIVVTQMAGSTDVIVASEPMSYGASTYNYNVLFNTIKPDMTAQEMAAIMVRNVEAPDDGDVTMLTSIDVTDSRLAESLEALAEAVAASLNEADKIVLINALLRAPQDGCLYDGTEVQQSDLGCLIVDVLLDPDFDHTSEGFRKALADVMTALNAIVLEYRSVPADRGSGIAVCNTVCTAQKLVGQGYSPEKTDATVKDHILSNYKSNPLWGGLLYDLCATFLAEASDVIAPPAIFSVSSVAGLVEGRNVAVSDLSCFSGAGAQFRGIHVIGESFFSFLITAKDKSTGGFIVSNDVGEEVTISLLSSDGKVIASGANRISFENLAEGSYYLRLQSGKNCCVILTSNAEFRTGVDRFDYAGSGKNEEYANGNGSIAEATPLDDGYYSGLITYKGDTDYYRIGNIHTERYLIQVTGQEGWTVAEYDKDGTLVQSAAFSDGKYTLTMASQNYLLVESSTKLEEAVSPYTLNIIGVGNDYTTDIVLDDLTGSKDEVSWGSSTVVSHYRVDFSMDSFEHVFVLDTTGTTIDLLGLPAGTYQWRVKAKTGDDDPWYTGEEIVSDVTNDKPKVFRSRADASDDLFFASPNGTWSNLYCARHVGFVDGWSGTGEMVSAAGKGRIQDFFFGSADPGTLFLTDSDNGDALFLDDAYTGLPEEIEENSARLFRLHKIMAGAGDDIIDMTSRRFEYAGGKLFICGGDGDDVIWASRGKNTLCGDAGNDRIIGASGNDVIAGGIGNDTMHGGGGDDVFTFCENWGVDNVEQLAGGSVTLWFASGDIANWNKETLTYSDGENSVTVSGVTSDVISLKFGNDNSEIFTEINDHGAFAGFTSRRIFEMPSESGSGVLA